MRLNLKIFISGDTFDDPPFFYQQLKFTWLFGISIAFELGGMSMRPVGTIPFYDTFKLIAVFAACEACASGFSIARSLMSDLNITSESAILRELNKSDRGCVPNCLGGTIW